MATCVTPTASFAREHTEESKDPLMRINYRDAFDQTKIHEQYKDLMIRLSCDRNVFQNDHINTSSLPDLDADQIKAVQKEFTNACIEQLQKTRHWVIMQPARETVGILSLLTLATLATIELVGKESMGGSISIFSTCINAVYEFRGIIRSGVNIAYPPAHPLNALELLFATNQCFISKELWPIIIEKFTVARQNEAEQRNAMNFLEFSLGLTTYQPPIPMPINPHKIHEVIEELNTRIDTFFAQYNDQSDGQACRLLKINTAKFVLALTGDTALSSRYIYLHGPGGIGKTHFVRTLAQWFQELLPDTVCFNDLIITSADELEGNRTQPGSMLRVLRNQLLGKKRGSIVFMDEATWLNSPDMVSAAKRVFNGNQSKLSTSYFGSRMDGTGIDIALPPMLIFVASNEDIKDLALESRFDTINFPMPMPQLLIDHALHVAKNSKVLPIARIMPQEKILSWIQKNKFNNFRAIESKIEQFMMAKSA